MSGNGGRREKIRKAAQGYPGQLPLRGGNKKHPGQDKAEHPLQGEKSATALTERADQEGARSHLVFLVEFVM
jgi:hypothetical protein